MDWVSPRQRWLAVCLLLAGLCSLSEVQANPMKAMVEWLNPCLAYNSTCAADFGVFAAYTYGSVSGKQVPDKFNSSQLGAVCRGGCLPALGAQFATINAGWSANPVNQQICGTPADPTMGTALISGLLGFVCWPGDDSAGACITRVATALRSVGLWDQVKAVSPTLKFTGPTLDTMCRVLRPQSCCLKTFAHLFGAIAHGLCMPDVGNEFLSLPGRCSAEGQVSEVCSPAWEAAIAPLLGRRRDCTLWNSTNQAGLGIYTGTGCTQQQLAATTCPTNPCDLWCGIVGKYTEALSKATATSSSSEDTGLSTGVVVFIAIFSAFVLVLLIAAAVALCMMMRKERARRLRSRRSMHNQDSLGGLSSFKSARESLPSLGPRASAVSAATSGAHGYRLPGSMQLSQDYRHSSSTNPTTRDRLMDIAMLPPTASMAGRSSVGSMTGRLSLAGMPTESLAGGSMAGRTSAAGRTSMAGRSSLTVRSLREELDVVGPLPQPAAAYTYNRVSDPVHYGNVLYGGVLPSSNDQSASTSGAGTPPHTLLSTLPPGPSRSPPTTPPTCKSQSFSFGVDTSPIESVRSATQGGEWRTAVGMAAATGSARLSVGGAGPSNEFPLPSGRARSNSGRPATPSDIAGGGYYSPRDPAAAAAAAAAASTPTGRWRLPGAGSGGGGPASGADADYEDLDEDSGAFHDAASGPASRSSGWYSAGGNSGVGSGARGPGSAAGGGGAATGSGTPGWATPAGSVRSGAESPAVGPTSFSSARPRLTNQPPPMQ